MASDTMPNGRHTQRKQLSAQLDRLDNVLDGLAGALNRSVAGAVKDVVGQVVKEAVETTIGEVLGGPDLLHAAPAQQPLAAQPVVVNPGVWHQWRDRLALSPRQG
jgi:hypothetical protein